MRDVVNATPIRQRDAVRPARLSVALVAFLFITWVASLAPMHRLDEAVSTWLQRGAPAPDAPATVVMLLGNAEVVIPGAALTAALLLPRRRDAVVATVWLAVWLGGLSLLAVGLKHVIVHPGPTAAFERPVLFKFGVHAVTPYSFPSGHTLRTTLLAWSALPRAHWLAGAIILVMMTALVYLGAHWFSDVLGGLCLGWVAIEARAVLSSARSRSYPRG